MTTPLTIIGFSGPPRAGKDTAMRAAASYLTSQNTLWAIERLSRPLKEAAIAILPDKNFAREERKDEIEPTLHRSFRQVQIDIFHMGAQAFGSDWLGRHMAQRLISLASYQARQDRPAPVILCPDFGRLEEVQVLIDAGHRVSQFVVYRPHTTFSGDSRTLFFLPSSFQVFNDGTIEEFQASITSLLPSLLPPK